MFSDVLSFNVSINKINRIGDYLKNVRLIFANFRKKVSFSVCVCFYVPKIKIGYRCGGDD